nr:phage portal protein [uncultured Oscillibacter sp.]
MSRLSAFLHPVTTQMEEEIVVSSRFLDEKGNPVPFKVRSLTQEENDALTKQSTRRIKMDGLIQDRLDNVEYTRRLVVAATVDPDFSSKELCDGLGVVDPLLVPGKLLLPGEYRKLCNKIMELSGFDETGAEEAEAKN